MAGQLLGCVCAAAFHCACRPANLSASINRGEVVQYVEAGNLEIPFVQRICCGSQVDGDVVCCLGWLDAVQIVIMVHDPGHICHPVPAAEQVRQIKLSPVRMNGGIRILAGPSII